MRTIPKEALQAAFDDMREASWQEIPEYYDRYRSRYEAVLLRYANLAPPEPQEIIEIGGGQLAHMAQGIWGDKTTVADVTVECFPDLNRRGVRTVQWDLARNDYPGEETFDFVLCSEVLEHLPIPGHVALRRLRQRLRPGGHLLLTTPNLYRIRNVAFLAMGRQIFDHYDLPGERGFGHVLEYSRDHLAWQLDKAGFEEYDVELVEFRHLPIRRADRVLSALATPLRRVPRLRDNLMVTARSPD